MSNLVTLYLFVFVISAATSCYEKDNGHGDDKLTFANASTESIFVLLQFNFPDTTINNEAYTHKAYISTTVQSGMKKEMWNSINWESFIKKNNSQSTVMFFVFSSDTVQSKEWSQIRQEYNILKRYDLSVDQLKAQDWKITYP